MRTSRAGFEKHNILQQTHQRKGAIACAQADRHLDTQPPRVRGPRARRFVARTRTGAPGARRAGAGAGAGRPARDLQRRRVGRAGGIVEGAVPAVPREAGGTAARDGGAGAREAPAEGGAGDAGGPLGVEGAVAAGGSVETVSHDSVALGDGVGGLEGGDVAHGGVGAVGEVDDEGRDGGPRGEVRGVAAEEGGLAVEAEVDKGVGVGHGGEGGAVGDGGQGALVGGAQRRTVGPVEGRVGRAVDGEDDVDGALGLDERVEGDVLQILAAVDEGELAGGGTRVAAGVEPQEGVGGPLGDVVVVDTT